MSGQSYDIIVMGAGIGGASIAALSSGSARVLVLEREAEPGYHSTGRSAAAYIPSYGSDNPALFSLTKASRSFFLDPPAGFREVPLLRQRGLLTLVAEDGPKSELSAKEIEVGVKTVDAAFLATCLPPLRKGFAHRGLFEPDVFDIDVDVLHQGFLKQLRSAGGDLVLGVTAQVIERRRGRWNLTTDAGEFSAPILVNAAGAWADDVAELSGVRRIGLTPLRRTAVLIKPPSSWSIESWPLVMSQREGFYFKPDAGGLLISPADEHPSLPCDAQPEEIDVAFAVHHLEQALDVSVSSVSHKWAGLRSFVGDRTPVVGFDKDVEGFYWLAGQGGHGIQVSPALAAFGASQLLGNQLPTRLEEVGFDPAWVSPNRSSIER